MAIKRLICKLLSLEEKVQGPHEYLKKNQSIFKNKRMTVSKQTK